MNKTGFKSFSHNNPLKSIVMASNRSLIDKNQDSFERQKYSKKWHFSKMNF